METIISVQHAPAENQLIWFMRREGKPACQEVLHLTLLRGAGEAQAVGTAVERSLRDDGVGCMACLATRQIGSATPCVDLVCHSAHVECGLDVAFLWTASPVRTFEEMIMLFAANTATLLAFVRVNRLAGWLLVLYLAWVSFVAALNFTIWRLNP